MPAYVWFLGGLYGLAGALFVLGCAIDAVRWVRRVNQLLAQNQR